jgi:hypothetical protein
MLAPPHREPQPEQGPGTAGIIICIIAVYLLIAFVLVHV